MRGAPPRGVWWFTTGRRLIAAGFRHSMAERVFRRESGGDLRCITAGVRQFAAGMHPPFSFVLPKENAPCTVEEKNASGAYGGKLQRPAKTGVEFAEDMEGIGGLYRAARVRWVM